MIPALQQGNRQDLAAMTLDFNPWLNQIKESRYQQNPNRYWFAQVIEMLIEFGFILQEDEVTIVDGGPLTFTREHAQAAVSRDIEFPIAGSWMGIELSDEMESHEQIMSVRTPLNVVRAAIEALNPAPVVEPALP